jgi:hypothetical protein
MKRQQHTIADVYGLESEEELAKYNKWLLHPNRPYGVPIKKFKEEYVEEKKEKKRKGKRDEN